MTKKKTTKKTESISKRKRRAKPYPSIAFEDALVLGKAIEMHSGGQSIKRLTLMEKMERSPTSGSTRAMITDSSKYGVTNGSYTAEALSLTEDGKTVCSDQSQQRAKTRASFKLAIEGIVPFKSLFDRFVSNRLPSKEVMRDYLIDNPDLGVHEDDIHECIDIFIVNCKHVGVLRLIAGNETLVPLDNVLDELPSKPEKPAGENSMVAATVVSAPGSSVSFSGPINWEKSCFYISPIGEDGTAERRHSDLFLSSLVRPAVEELGLEVRRADEIDHAGMITGVVMEWLDKAKLVIADLSMLNPNVFYEMALRHAQKKPLVCIIQKSDKIPFDVNQLGVIPVDNTDLYTFVPQISSYVSQITAKARRALEDPTAVGNPLSSFYPAFWDSIANTDTD